MKKIYKSLFVAVMAALSFTACDDNDSVYEMTSPAITIVSRDTNFPAGASTGSVKFKADGPVTVSTNNNWITATVEGDEIKIECTQNDDLQGRTGVVTVKSNAGTTDINIIQEGILFQIADMDDLTFDSSPGTREIAVNANALVEVSSDEDWISGTCEDGVLKVTIAQNPTFADRTGELLIKYGVNSLKLPVTQQGIYLEIFDIDEWVIKDTRQNLTITLPFDIDVEFETENIDWLTSQVNKNTRTWRITATANNSGHMRIGSFSYNIGGKTGTVSVRQCDFTKDLAGSGYNLYFTDVTDGVRKYFEAELKKIGGSYKINIPKIGLSIPVTYSDDTHILNVKGGEFCGIMDPNYVYTTFVYYDPLENGNFYTWSELMSMQGRPDYKESNGSAVTSIAFENTPANQYPFIYFQLYAFKSSSLNASNGAGYIMKMTDVVLSKTTSGAQTAQIAAIPAEASLSVHAGF